MKKLYLLICLFVFSISVQAKQLKIGEVAFKKALSSYVDIKKLTGKVVIINFWATWCPPCRKELPFFNRLYNKYKDQGLVILAISIDKTASKGISLAKKMKLNFRIITDNKYLIVGKYEPKAMPTSFFVNRNGNVQFVHNGFKEKVKATMEKELLLLLNEKGDSK